MLPLLRRYFTAGPPWLTCLPFLAAYLTAVALFGDGALAGDEYRHLAYARYFAGEGAFSEGLLWSGPGYGLFLAPFVRLGLGVYGLTALNAVLHYGSVVALLHGGRRDRHTPDLLLVAVVAWATYVPALQTVRTLYSEPLATLLLLLVGISLRSLVRPAEVSAAPSTDTLAPWRVLATAALLALLALTKVIVAYALAAGLVAGGAWMLLRRSRRWLRPWTAGLLALALTLPYLAVTHRLTGHPVYALAGGSSLYPMTSGHPGETGSWIPPDFALGDSFTQGPADRARVTARWRADHRDTRAALATATNAYQRDSVYRDLAWRQLRERPGAYLRNVAYNAARMLANWPYSHYAPHWLSLVYLSSNAVLLAVAGVGLRRSGGRVGAGLTPLAVLTSFMLLGSLALAAYPRQLYVLWPALLLVAVSGAPRGRRRRGQPRA